MTKNWHEDQLEKGRLLIRGTLFDSLHADLTLYCLGATDPSHPSTQVLSAKYAGLGQKVRLIWELWPDHSWEDQWCDIVSRWTEPSNLSFARHWLVVIGNGAKPGTTLPSTDPRLLLHYGALLHELHQKQGHPAVGDERVCDLFAPKLRRYVQLRFGR